MRVGRLAAVALLVVGAVAGVAPRALAVPEVLWHECAELGGVPEADRGRFDCAEYAVPLDHDHPGAETITIAMMRRAADDRDARIGSLFLNPGGPGASGYLMAAAAPVFLEPEVLRRFDVIGFDPRGVGRSTPLRCFTTQEEADGVFANVVSVPVTPEQVREAIAANRTYEQSCGRNGGTLLDHMSTADVARDLDLVRAAVGDPALNYLGFSYGTFLGATYAALFPDRYRTMVLDGAIDADEYVNDPISSIAEQTAGFEQSLARFTEACAVDQVACSGFGGTDPYLAYDRLLAAAETAPIPADAYPADPRPVTADDIRLVTTRLLYGKQLWGLLGLVLSEAADGDASFIRALVDSVFRADSAPGDRQFTISASEQRYPRDDLQVYLDRGAESWASFPHFGGNSGYTEIHYALWPVRDEDAFAGPFEASASAPAPLVIGTTYDPATPYAWAERLAADLGTARLLTMEGDGHAAYGGESACIDSSTEAYLVDGALPAAGTVCRQDTPFLSPVPAPTTAAVAAQALSGLLP